MLAEFDIGGALGLHVRIFGQRRLDNFERLGLAVLPCQRLRQEHLTPAYLILWVIPRYRRINQRTGGSLCIGVAAQVEGRPGHLIQGFMLGK